MPGLFVEKPTLAGGAHGDVVLAEPHPADTPASLGEETVASTSLCIDDDPASETEPCAPEALPEEPTPEPEPELVEPEPAPDVEPVLAAVPALAPVVLFEPEVGLAPELAFAPEALPETFEPSVLDEPEQAARNETEIKSPRMAFPLMAGSMKVQHVGGQTISNAARGSVWGAESSTCVE